MRHQTPAILSEQLGTIRWRDPINRKTALTRNLKALWVTTPGHYGFGTNKWLDLCGNYNSTLTNMDAATDWVRRKQSGQWGYLDFDGSNDYVNCGNVLNATANMTVFAVVKPDGSTRDEIISKESGSTGWTFTSLVTTRYIYFGVFVGSSNAVTGTTALSTTDWNFVAGVRSVKLNTLRVYVNGVLDNTAALTGSPASNSQNLWIGANPFPAHYFDGRISCVGVYLDRALSDQEIRKLYQETRSFFPSIIAREQPIIGRSPVVASGNGAAAYYYRMMQGQRDADAGRLSQENLAWL